jgi:cardiolipin synthase A/B
MIKFIAGNDIKLLRCGAEYFPALEAAIDGAENEIHLQTYIYEADDIGQRIGDAMKRAVTRGVQVNLLLDGFGSKELSKAYVKELQRAGIRVMFYRPRISPWTLKRNRLRRLHVKIAIVDGHTAFIGGINIINDTNEPKLDAPLIEPRIDYAVKIEGALLPAITANVRHIWRRIAWSQLRRVDAKLHAMLGLPDTAQVAGNTTAAYVVRDNVLHRHDIERAYLKAIAQAKHEIIIANAYFLPGRRFRRALVAAARRGVKIKLLLQGRVEYFFMFATHALYSGFLRNGIEIYEYRKSFMHSKVAVIDSHWATVGSSNIDPFSLLLAREANIVVQDGAFATELKADIERSIKDGAVRIDPDDWVQGHNVKRLVSWLVNGFVRFGLGIIGLPDEN